MKSPSSGAGPISALAQEKLAAGAPVEAMHLLDIALAAEPRHGAALRVKRETLQALLAASGGTNLSEVMWLKSEIAAVEAALSADGPG